MFLKNCKFEKTLILRDARLGAVMLPGCHVPGINGDRLRVERSIHFNEKFKARGPVILDGVKIGVQFTCSSGAFSGWNEKKLKLDGMALSC